MSERISWPEHLKHPSTKLARVRIPDLTFFSYNSGTGSFLELQITSISPKIEFLVNRGYRRVILSKVEILTFGVKCRFLAPHDLYCNTVQNVYKTHLWAFLKPVKMKKMAIISRIRNFVKIREMRVRFEPCRLWIQGPYGHICNFIGAGFSIFVEKSKSPIVT